MSERLTQITVVSKGVHQLLPGEASYIKEHHTWYLGCPAPHCGVANLANHDVTYDEQSHLLTVSPSILCGCGAHYFIEHNQIRWC